MIILLGVLIILSSLTFTSGVNAQDQTTLLSNESSNKIVLQKYLNDNDKKLNEINYLLELIKGSSFSFERNGQKGSSKEAFDLLKFKLNQYRNQIHTTEDFIEKIASYSNHTHKSYYVILPDGEKSLLKDLLYAELKKLRIQENKGSMT